MEHSVRGRNAHDASARGVDLPDRYTVGGLIGVGGMASIWAAEDRQLRRLVAIKVLAEQFADQPNFVARFEREARTAASLSGQPHVVTIYDVGEHDGRPFIVMERLSGGTFADRMSAGRPDREEILRWLGEAASALDFAHEKGVVHRDVKPRNLLFDDHGRLVVADFGIARAAFEDSLTASGELLGTAAYIAPEQVAGGAATPASDRYALAVVAYEALTGGLPFGGGTLIEIATKRSQMDPPRPSERAPELPPAVDDVMLRALHADPAQRWPSATEFVEALERAFAQGAPPPPPTMQPPMTVQRVRPHRSVPVAAILLGLAAVAIGTIVGLTVLRDDSGGGTRADRGRVTTQDRREQMQPRQRTPTKNAVDSPAALNDQGFQLMNAGRYDDAIPVLQRAVAAFPADSTELTYAYALYNLGRSLRLAGRAGEAIPILERRLQFANQRGVVKRELAAARRATGG